MDVIKTLKDIIVFTQKSNDIEMTQKLISIQQEVIDMEDQIYKLKTENRELKEKINKRDEVERYRNIPIITLKEDSPKILYCANCYGSDNKLIQLQVHDIDHCYCRNCKDQFFIHNSPDAEKIKEKIEKC